MKVRRLLAAAAIISLSGAPVLAEPPTQNVGATNQLYVADYGTGKLSVYSATLTYTGGVYSETLTQATPVQSISAPNSGNITEGIEGTNNDLISVVKTSGGAWELARFTKAGSFIGYVGGGSTTFTSIGSFALSADGKDAYIADPSDNGGEVAEISLSTGNVVATQSLSGAHDVGVLTNGSVIAEALNGSPSTSAGIEEYSSSLGSASTFVPIGTQGQLEPGTEGGSTSSLQGNNQYGFTIDSSGNVWIASDDRSGGPGDVDNESGTVYEFSSTGTFLNSWTLTDISSTLAVEHDFVNSSANIGEVDSSANNPYAVGTFGLTFGGDGNLYMSDLGGVVLADNPSNTSSPTNGGNNVTEFNTSTDLFSIYLQGDTGGGGSDNGTVDPTTGLSAPKYSNWATDFISADDAGVPTPEPSGSLTGTAFVGIVGLLLFSSLRRSRRNSLNAA